MLDDRKLTILRAIVTDYVSMREPVGSRALVERYHLDVSPATVRNDMAVLEEEGYITQPHTSAGRIPTDKGYRLFVDRLGAVKPLSGRGTPGHRDVHGRCPRHRRRGAPHRPAAGPDHPAGRDRAVPDRVRGHHPAHRDRHPQRRAGPADPGQLHRQGRPAHRRPRRCPGDCRRRPARTAERRPDRAVALRRPSNGRPACWTNSPPTCARWAR